MAFLDLGTNAEMVMGNGNRLVCTAAAAGSAFEGRGGCGATGAERIAAIARLLEKGLWMEQDCCRNHILKQGVEVETGKGEGKDTDFEEDVVISKWQRRQSGQGFTFCWSIWKWKDTKK